MRAFAPARDQLALAIGRELAAPARVVGDERGDFVEDRVDGLGERPRDEAGADRAAAVDAGEAEVLGIGRRHPERQLVPRRDALLDEVRLADRDEAQRRAAASARRVDARLEHLGPAAGAAVLRSGRVESAARAGLDGAHDPVGEVADVDQLDRLVAAHVRHQDLAAGEGAPRPVAEPAGAVARADDQPGADDQRALAERRRDDALARRLLRPVVARAVGGRLRRCRRWTASASLSRTGACVNDA